MALIQSVLNRQMRYLDSGKRQSSQALGTWLAQALQPDVTEIRWQSGFFAANGLGFFQESLRRLAKEDRIVRAVIGSNDQCTTREDMDTLVTMLGLPRSRADLGIVSYSGAYFHPKTVHVRRSDGTQAAYVGSANLTESGVSSLHIEAGVTIDDREGDSTQILNEICSAVDQWFQPGSVGLYRVSAPEDVDGLVTKGIIGIAPPVTQTVAGNASSAGRAGSEILARLRPLIRIPRIRHIREPLVDITHPEIRQILLPATPHSDFPDYMLFSPGQTTPTEGSTALSGSSLPSGVSGILFRLSRDTSRHFAGGSGTANLSIPVATLSSFRFGRLARGKFRRPRAEFGLRLRYVTASGIISLAPSRTNLMGYGFLPGEPGHRDVRMVVPAAVKSLAGAIQQAGAPLPQPGDVAFLEWPTTNQEAEFRLTFVDSRSDLFHKAQDIFTQALSARSIVAAGACWLPSELAPRWTI